jgi:hypothetical protein
MKSKTGWFNVKLDDPFRHAQAARGIKTGRKQYERKGRVIGTQQSAMFYPKEKQEGLFGKEAQLKKRLVSLQKLKDDYTWDKVKGMIETGAQINQPDFEQELKDEFERRWEKGINDGTIKTIEDAEKLVSDINDYGEGIISDDLTEPILTIYYGDMETPELVGSYTDTTDGDFTAEYHRTDAWRGYYEPKSSDKWVNVHSDNILSMSEDAQELEKFDKELRENLDKKEVEYARVFSRSSNVFSTGYDFFVEKGKELPAKAMVMKLSLKYRDPERYKMTALTGKDTFTDDDKLLAQAHDRLQAGESFESVSKDIIKRKSK